LGRIENKLFIFTKHYPYGNLENYLHEEILFFSQRFDSIVLVPTELFEVPSEHRQLPKNAIILNINNESKSHRVNLNLFKKLVILMSEFYNEKDKIRFIREFKRYLAILNHQFMLTDFFSKYLSDFDSKNYFYSYWLHNSSIMLGVMKQKGVIKSFISRAHSIDLFHNDWPFAYEKGVEVLPFQYFKVKTSSAIHSISESGILYLRKKFPQFKDKFHLSYLGIKNQYVSTNKDENIFRIVSCSNISKNKRVDKIAEVVSKLSFNCHWIHFGSGDEFESVKKITNSFQKNITFSLPGLTKNVDIINFYKFNYVDLFINLSLIEGIPVSIMEAISFGIPIIATGVNGNKEIVNDRTGFIVPRDFQIDEVVSKINLIFSDINLQKKLRDSARHFYLEKFDSEKNYLSFYNYLINT
jgi:glycosyltransferase involved in cell wall biosynthesis